MQPRLQAVNCQGNFSSMGDDNFKPALNQGFAYDRAILKGGQTRRRLAMGRDAALESEPDEERDPEGPVTDCDELVRCEFILLRAQRPECDSHARRIVTPSEGRHICQIAHAAGNIDVARDYANANFLI